MVIDELKKDTNVPFENVRSNYLRRVLRHRRPHGTYDCMCGSQTPAIDPINIKLKLLEIHLTKEIPLLAQPCMGDTAKRCGQDPSIEERVNFSAPCRGEIVRSYYSGWKTRAAISRPCRASTTIGNAKSMGHDPSLCYCTPLGLCFNQFNKA